MKPSAKQLFFLFALVSLIELAFIATQNNTLRLISKPLIIPLLMACYLTIQQPRKPIMKDHILQGLFFSWIGDILLQSDGLFIPGLLSFLIAHICYIIFFIRTNSNQHSFFKLRPIMLLAVMAYLVELMNILWPHLGPMKVPVLLYGITISVMLSAAMWQYQKLDNKTALFFILGATLFVISDSLLALNRFREPFAMAGISIMATYILAQLFIVMGAIKLQVQEQSSTTA